MVLYRRAASTGGPQMEESDPMLPFGDDDIHEESYGAKRAQSLGALPTFSSQFSPTFNPAMFKGSKVEKSKISFVTIIQWLSFIFMIAFVWFSRSALSDREKELVQLRNDFEFVEDTLLITETELNSAHDDFRKLSSELKALREHNKEEDELIDRQEISESILKRQNAMVDRILKLQNNIADLHRGEAEKRYGPGPYRLRFNVRFDEEYGSFIVEMAPLALMAHSVHLFMQMVEAELWTDSVILHRAEHLLYVAPFTSEGVDKSPRFDEANLNHLTYPEYTDEFPHDRYTIGFAGRPGGPEFYFNTKDNSESHGPGGQMQHDLHEEADACFGKVVDGFEVFDFLQEQNVAAVKRSSEGVEEVHFTVLESIEFA